MIYVYYNSNGNVIISDVKPSYKSDYIKLNQSDIPNFIFSDAWEIKDKKIIVNLEKAKKIKIKQLNLKKQRVLNSFYKPIEDARDEAMLDPSDINNSELHLLIKKKRKVRDLEFNLSNIKTIKGLENYMPKELKD